MVELPNWLTAVLLGAVEGLTEFLPVSSTGHLLVVEHWLPRQSDLFNVVIQSGAVLAVLPLFKERLAQLVKIQEPASRLLWAMIGAAFAITGVGGVLLKKLGLQLPKDTAPVAWALIVGGVVFILVERLLRDKPLAASNSWKTTVAVGFAQLVAAAFPGASRSGATIMASMLSGSSRAVATEFSFLVGIPTMLAAGALETVKALKNGTDENWSLLLLATAVASAVSFATVKWLLRFVQTHSFTGFGVYRIVAGILLLWLP
jgi:undecaprenyl-diphosphatase